MSTEKEKRTGVLISIAIASFINPFMISGLAVALPSMGEHFNISPGTLGIVETSFLAATLILLLPVGKFADKFGLGRIYISGMVLFILSSFLLGFASSFPILILFRFFQGFATAMLTSTGIAILTNEYPAEDRGRVIGIAVGAVYIGLSLGPFVGGFITHSFGWRYIFIFGAFLSIIALILVLKNISFKKKLTSISYNYKSAFLYIFFITLIWIGFSRLQNNLIYIVSLLFGIIGFIYFLSRENKSSDPIIDVRLFRTNKAFSLGNSLTFINYASSIAVTFTFSLFLQYIKGYSPQQTGLVLVIQPIIQSIFAPISGKLSDRYNPNILVFGGMFSCFLGLLIVLFINEYSSMIFIYSLLIFFGFGFALFSSANTNQVMSSVSRSNYGVASSMVGAMRTMGMLTSISIASGIFNHFIGDQKMTQDLRSEFLKGVQTSFVIYLIISFLGLFLAYKLLRLKSEKK
jgi:MFS family permease